ncbi:MAG: hypothetical protein HY236_01965 [Acidobacteria bacterium]|nr:hypothetical protein [Acidobacteriota bacterium]
MLKNLLRTSALLLFVFGTLQGTMVPALSLEEIVERSEQIVHGRCLRTWTSWDAQTRAVWTHNEIEVADVLKGGRTQTVVVSEPGGRLGDIETWIAGMPRYEPGEEVVVFLYRTPIGFVRSRGLGQGKFTVQADPASGELRVQAQLGGAAVVEPAGAARMPRIGLQQLDGERLEAFKAQVRGLVIRQAQGGRQ